MNRIIFSLLAFVSVTAWAQEPRDSTESVKQFVELQEVVIRGGLPNTRLKAGAMITRIEGTPLAQSGTLGEMLVMVPPRPRGTEKFAQRPLAHPPLCHPRLPAAQPRQRVGRPGLQPVPPDQPILHPQTLPHALLPP